MGNDQTKDLIARKEGRAGRLTLNRPKALNALTAAMSIGIEESLSLWRDDGDVDLVLIDAVGDRAFCAGGDIADLYAQGVAGHFGFGQAFWDQEYRMNLCISTYPKPVVVFMQGFVMGGGVGVASHASHRIVGETSRVAMPECGIGLIPDVGGSLLLGRAPGHVGAYLGLTGARMGPADAILATFADTFVPTADWDALKTVLIDTGDVGAIATVAAPAGDSALEAEQAEIDGHFGAATLGEIVGSLRQCDTPFATKSLERIGSGAPLAQACGLAAIQAAKGGSLREALAREYRFVYRAQAQGDFLEGIRALIIDRDFMPKWKHITRDVPQEDVDAMLAPLGDAEWTAKGTTL